MRPDLISQFINYDCPITYSKPVQKTIVDIDGEGELSWGFFDKNSDINAQNNEWNFFFRNSKNEFERRIINGNKVKSLKLIEEGILLYGISDKDFINKLFLSKRWETRRNYFFFYS